MFGVYSQQGTGSITLNEIIITSDASYVYTSLDGGATWTTITVGSGTNQDIIIWGNNEFVFVRTGVFFTSPDGINWTNTGVTVLYAINKFIYADGYYFVSNGGTNAINLCSIVARQSFSSGTWTSVYTAPTTGYIDTLTYYDGRVYFIYQTTSSPTFHSILVSNLTVTNYGVMNSGIGAIRMTELYRVYNGWVARGNSAWTIAYTTTNTGWSISTNTYYNATSILVTDGDNFNPPRDYVAVFATNSAGTFNNGGRFSGIGNSGSNAMRTPITNVHSDGTYFYCYDSVTAAGLYRRLIINWNSSWTRDAGATTAGINGNFTLMATGGTPNNVYIIRSGTLYKTVSGSGTYTSLGASSPLKFVGRV